MQNEANEKQMSLPLEALQRIEAVCIEYEESSPETRDIASLLKRSKGETERLKLLEELVALDVEFKSVAGKNPGFSDYESLATNTTERERLEVFFDCAAERGGEKIKVLPGAKVGNYVIQKEIGQGGMGVVYLAKRERDFEKSVAIKVIRRDFLSEELVQRFRHETQIQGKIGDHPNIVSLIDAGETDDGEPFLVTEFVDGLRLDDYLESQTLSVDQKLELFQQINAGIAFAHQNAIIHRDIKPSNILVSSDGIPKIIDFGLAKLVEVRSQRETITVAMTPMYASPEQVRGESATTASDIYSLGVVLYESLTGQSPYKTSSASLKELVQSVTEEQPVAPSQRIREAAINVETQVGLADSTLSPQRQSQIRSSEKRISSDLDQIVLKAIRKEPARRYQTVNAFSEDITRLLLNKTVSARPDSIGYRVSKFIVRNKLPVGAATLLVMTLIGGIVGTASGWLNALSEQKKLAHEQEKLRLANAAIRQNLELLEKSSQLNRQTIFEFMTEVSQSSELMSNARTRGFRIRLFERAADKFTSMISLFSNDKQDQLELAQTHYWLGFINHDLGLDEDSKRSYQTSLQILKELQRDAPDDLKVLEDLGSTQNEFASLLRTMKGELANGLAMVHVATATREELHKRDQDNLEYKRQLVRSYSNYSVLLRESDRYEEATEYSRKAVSMAEEGLTAKPDDEELRFLLAASRSNVASDFYISRKFPESLSEFEEALGLIVPLSSRYPGNLRFRWEKANNLYHIGFLQRINRNYEASAKSYAEAMPVAKSLIEEDPASIKNQILHANIQNGIGASFLMRQNYSDAIAPLEESATGFRHATEAAPDRMDVLRNLQAVLTNLSYAYRDQRKLDKAVDSSSEAIEIGERLFAIDPSMQIGVQVVTAKGTLASLMGETGDWKSSKAEYAGAIKLGENLVKEFATHPMPKLAHAANMVNFAGVLTDHGENQDAIELLNDAIPFLQTIVAETPQIPQATQFLSNALKNRADAHYWSHDFENSIADYDASVAVPGARFGLDRRIERACALFKMGEQVEALEEIKETLESRPGDPSVPFYAATFYSVAAETTDDDEKFSSYIAKAIQLLEESEKDDYVKSPARIDVLESDRKFELLRRTDAFRDWSKSYLGRELR